MKYTFPSQVEYRKHVYSPSGTQILYVETFRRKQRRTHNHRAGSKDGFSRLRTQSWCWRVLFAPRAPFYSKLLHGIRFRVVLWEESSSTQSPLRAVYSQVIFGYAMVRESSPKWVGEDVMEHGVELDWRLAFNLTKNTPSWVTRRCRLLWRNLWD